jgi:hypothetical protein
MYPLTKMLKSILFNVLKLQKQPTLFGQSSQGGLIPMEQVRQTQGPLGMVMIP